jgi:hypothetical protein
VLTGEDVYRTVDLLITYLLNLLTVVPNLVLYQVTGTGTAVPVPVPTTGTWYRMFRPCLFDGLVVTFYTRRVTRVFCPKCDIDQ